MRERPNRHAWKACVGQLTVGSNPTPSARNTQPEEIPMADLLPAWRDTPAKKSILDFVAAVTDPKSDAFVPEVERVAVFDNDGTLSTETPYAQLAFALDRAAELGQPTTPEELKAGG